MPLSREDRIMYLERAREAKKLKNMKIKDDIKKVEEQPKEEVKPEVKEVKQEVIKEKPKKNNMKKVNNTLDLSKMPDEKPPAKIEIENEQVVEVVEVVQRIKKPKRVVKRIVKQEYDSDDTDETEIQIIEPPTIQARHKPKTKKEVQKTAQIHDISTTLFNY
jgi:hypothetical protein